MIISPKDTIYKHLIKFLMKNSSAFQKSNYSIVDDYEDIDLQNNESDNSLENLISLAIVINTD